MGVQGRPLAASASALDDCRLYQPAAAASSAARGRQCVSRLPSGRPPPPRRGDSGNKARKPPDEAPRQRPGHALARIQRPAWLGQHPRRDTTAGRQGPPAASTSRAPAIQGENRRACPISDKKERDLFGWAEAWTNQPFVQARSRFQVRCDFRNSGHFSRFFATNTVRFANFGLRGSGKRAYGGKCFSSFLDRQCTTYRNLHICSLTNAVAAC